MCSLNQIWSVVGDHAGEFLAALAGAGFGSLTAYLFQKRQEAAATADRKYAMILEAKMILGFHISTLVTMQKALAPYKDRRDQPLLMGLKLMSHDKSRIDLRGLSFIAHDSKTPNVLMDLHLAESRYFNTLDAFDYRNQLYKELGEAAHVSAFDPATKLASIQVDIRKAQPVIDATNALFTCAENTSELLPAVLRDLDTVSKELFPDRKSVRFQVKEDREAK